MSVLRSLRLIETPPRSALLALLLAVLAWVVLLLSFPATLRVLEERSADWIWRMAASGERERRIILVDIDENSLQQLGSWPWSRSRMAELSDRLNAEGAALQVFDMVFPSTAAGDDQFLRSLQKNNAVLGQVFALEENTGAASGVPAGALPWAACPPVLPVAKGHIANHAGLSGLPTGHITPRIEVDGVIRHQPGIICDQGKAYPALFIAALGQALDKPELRFEAGRGLFGPDWQLYGPSLTRDGLPLDDQGNVRIPWMLQPDSFISLSAADVLAGRVPQGLLANAWVLVGSTALGLNDRIATPFGGSGAGLTVHAQLLHGVLDNHLPVTPRLGLLYQALAAVAGTLLLLALSRFCTGRPLLLVTGTALLLALLWLLKALLLVRFALWLEWVQVGMFLCLLALILSFVEHLRSRLERDRLYNHLASYLPASVAAALVRQDPSDTIDATRANITVLFADIRNFSGYCETNPPEAATAVLHAFFSMVTKVVEQHNGQVESFQGDAVLAVWGTAGNGPDPESALRAALDILQASRSLLPPPLPEDLAPLGLGIGLETGMATVGSFGLARRRTHLAIGHTVTTAARLQEMTAELAHPILVGEGMAASLGDHRLNSQGSFLLEGLKSPCHIYAYPLKECSGD
ncbi:CHASE2 domain-containing protein [Azonexus sp.]|uniref:CHASE2 domain-containing protein n=1 Tax=Azonexus sp. TaxID=1872668 RepID=UPI0027BA9919|nr:adenylate/guanylate cyclase domain-containing protein [Azonexus sp.]